MSKQRSLSQSSLLPTVLAGVVLACAGLVYFSGAYKVLTLLAGLLGLWLLLRRDLTPLRTIPAILLLAYVVFSGVTRFWAVSGKFFLREYSEIFAAAVCFLAVLLAGKFDRAAARRVMLVMAVLSTVYAVLSVEAASSGLTKSVLTALLPALGGTHIGFEAGTRLTGILGNANVLASVLALGIFYSVCLLCGEEKDKLRLIYAGMAGINAFVFLLLFSMGGTACFMAAVVVYLIFAGEKRASALIRMLECALPALIWVFVAFPFFNQEGAGKIVPLVALIGCAAVVVLLEKLAARPLVAALEQRGKLLLGVLGGVIALAVVYVVLGVQLTGAYTFSGESLERSAYPAGGAHTLSVQAEGQVEVTVVSQNMNQVMMHTNTVLYSGSADGAEFVVPEDSEVCYFIFEGEDGAVLHTATLDSGESLKLKYTLLPGFVANRIQGLRANQNAIQRTVFFRDGMKLFAQSPLVGNGVGSFETAITSVQDFYYITKYTHNHYIQILLESGLLGLLPFVGALLGMAVLLFKRRKTEGWEFCGEYPALWAVLVMTAAHMAVEVSMSIVVFVCMAFASFGLIVRCCITIPQSEPVVQEEAEVKTAGGKKGKKNKKEAKAPQKNGKELAIRGVCAAVPAVFLVSLCCNMAAKAVIDSHAGSFQTFLSHLELAATLDPYEGNDAKSSYVNNVRITYQGEGGAFVSRANAYAAELLEVQSNSLPSSMMRYYMQTGQYEQAFHAAEMGAKYSASDPEVWNGGAELLRNELTDKAELVFADDRGAQLLDYAARYYQMLQQRNDRSMDTVALNVRSMDLFTKVLTAAASPEAERQEICENVLFASYGACDADADGVADQISRSSGVVFQGTEMAFAADGLVEIQVYEDVSGVPARMVIACEDPGAITIQDLTANITRTPVVEDGQAVYSFDTAWDGGARTLRIRSAAEQTLSLVEIEQIR